MGFREFLIFIISPRIWGWRGETLTHLYSTTTFSPLRDGGELLGCGAAVELWTKEAGAAAPSAIGTTAWEDVNKSLGWRKQLIAVWKSLEGFSYFNKSTTTVSLGLSECAVSASCTAQTWQRWWGFLAMISFSVKLKASKNQKKNSRQHLKDKTELESMNKMLVLFFLLCCFASFINTSLLPLTTYLFIVGILNLLLNCRGNAVCISAVLWHLGQEW